MKTALVFALAGLLLWAGCDSNNDRDREQALEDLSFMMTRSMLVFSTLSLTLQFQPPPAAVAKSAGDTLPCPTIGSVDFESVETDDPRKAVFNMRFNNCEEMTGDLTYTIASEIDSLLSFSLGFEVSGELEGTCKIHYDAFEQRIESTLDFENPPDPLFTLNGGLRATCGSESLTCAFAGEQYSIADPAVFNKHCN